jgi:glycerophosphoryl diester phosphodiesterase
MRILSHRGYWLEPAEKNSVAAFARSFSRGYGTETDLRDRNGALVISHDVADEGGLAADAFFQMHAAVNPELPLALNIKADGLHKLVANSVHRYGLTSAFVFDMSVPDMLGWLKAGVPTFARQSEYEQEPVLYDQAAGIWLDSFINDWWEVDLVEGHLERGKMIAIVSPELHGRSPDAVWKKLRDSCFRDDSRVMLCTDKPEAADRVIHEQD